MDLQRKGSRNEAGAAPRLLIVEDDEVCRTTLAMRLRDQGYEVEEAANGRDALQRLVQRRFHVLLADLRMGPVDGLELLREARKVSPGIPVVLMTGYASTDSAVAALREGATDYLSKPFDAEELLAVVRRTLDRLPAEVLAGPAEGRNLDGLIGRSPVFLELVSRILRVAATGATLLLTGESGTGKNHLARVLHLNSPRAAGPFVSVNCGALTESLLESELFGHARGAFTGASHARRGLIEAANGGTLFLDEIAEMPPALQTRLLHVLHDKEIRRVGETAPVRVDVRIAAATNQDLKRAVAEGRFREDLYYRLAVVALHVPSLRERRDDIPLLAQNCLDRCTRELGCRRYFSRAIMARLMAHPFPGNIRELANLVERMALLATSEEIGEADLLEPGTAREPARPERLKDILEAAERQAIEDALAAYSDLQSVASTLGVSQVTLWRKMKRLAITRG